MSAFDDRVRTAHGDTWQTEGRLRARHGGGAVEWPGVRLMASGLPYAQWNNGDLVDLARFDPEEVRAWYAARAGGAGVPWGMCVPGGTVFPHGRFVFAKRCMAVAAEGFVEARCPADVVISPATSNDIAAIARIDAEAFEEDFDASLAWIAPHVGAHGFTVALARLDGVPVGVATAVHTNDRAGRCAGIFGVGVVANARARGIGAALTTWLVQGAFDRGATLVHLNPNTEGAARIYARLGFVETPGFDIYTGL
jgi:GNAT superfamily N-acetyltransferase